ncbi:polysaccharide deacetylase [Peribacillus cavernae]|uniref:Polysaccharide deacetylase n=1 Tax=Peribacillus cavernae TaxID=1674310 RepID=A0A433HPE4_9BACI|nr:polysaccharide deacetylase [Peribacillus cavernae]MDQ0217397.1 peptidoglycan/xylan/chitin deacetylase (PgdA/CDA1 family) [Peribacillus cavernae]RUQ30154.1 polysaccharide deacetylase [Peribacillus cavernae]
MIDNPITWPNGAKCAVAITFDMDTDSILHLAHPDTADTRVSTTSWLKYDEVAIPRILKMYKKYDIKQTFFVPAWCIERYPKTVELILKDGHELAHHGYLHEHPNEISAEEELYWLQRGIEVIENFSGKRPRGWRAPMYNFSKHSLEFLAKEGFLYDSSLMGDDIPYILKDKTSKEVIELPTHWAMDDWPQYTHNGDLDYKMPINSPERAMEVFMSEFEAAWKYGGMWVSVWHPFVSGRLARCDSIDQMIGKMQEKGDVWFATLEEIALHVRTCVDNGTYKPRTVHLPYYDGRIPELQSNLAGGVKK